MKRVAYLLIVTFVMLSCSKKVLKGIDQIDTAVYETMVQRDNGINFVDALNSEKSETVKVKSIVCYFDLNSDELQPISAALLDGFLEINKGASIHVSGHACPYGENLYNLLLSRRRAQNVITTNDGLLNTDNCSIDCYGETQPVTTIESEYHMNRRVVITLKD